jgi:hypothetical protein
MLTWLIRRLHHSRQTRAGRHERRAMDRLARLPRAELQVVIHQLRQLTPECRRRVLEGLPAWQQQALQQALSRSRHPCQF